jgi:hypothetical protein
MIRGLQIKVVDPDDDYLGIEIRASNARFAGATRIYAGLGELSDFATRINTFPTNPEDERVYEFGSREPSIAGGYCRLRFHCLDRAGHAAIDIILEDDEQVYAAEHAQLSLTVEAADIDRFIERIRVLQQERSGEARLPSAV